MVKWHHYFEIYERHFNRFTGKTPVILEIGTAQGGSIEMWNYYFDNNCQIYCIDIDETCKKHIEDLNFNNVYFEIGDQSNKLFWENYLKNKPNFDIVIDDGGHTALQHITTFECLYNKVSDNGIYLIEDLETAYLTSFGGSRDIGTKKTFIEYSKNFIDMINSHYNNYNLDFRNITNSIHYYDQIIVLEKRKDNKKPMATGSFVSNGKVCHN